MESKFKIGQEIYYMNYDKPTKGIIKGVAFVFGEFSESSFKRKGTGNEPAIVYSTGEYSCIDESKAFTTKDELINGVFANL